MNRPALPSEPVTLPAYLVLRNDLIDHARTVIGAHGEHPTQADDLALKIADRVLPMPFVTALDSELTRLTTTDHRWTTGSVAGWRGREVTVLSPPHEVYVQLPYGGGISVDPDELD